MFEREVMISSLKKSSRDLSGLVEELEVKSRFDGIDRLYLHEVLKKIETAIRKVRKMEQQTDPMGGRRVTGFITHAW